MELENFFNDNDCPTHAKVGLYGTSGTGKTRTAYEIATGLIKEYKLDKPVVFFDTEKGSDWILPLFEKNGIKCLVKKSRTFSDLLQAVDIAENKASVMIIDSISHVWRELCESYLIQYNIDRKNLLLSKYGEKWVEKNFKPSLKLEFQHWGQIKPLWGKFTERYLNSNIHMIVCGRAGDIYEYIENENGKKELIKSGSKMATEKELSYEPSLLIELQRKTINNKETLIAIIEKDRADVINGKEFELVKYEDLKPHFDFINIGKTAKNVDFNKNASNKLFDGATLEPQDEFTVEKRNREIYYEEIMGLLDLKYSGSSAEAKKAKNDIINKVFNTLSKTKLENTSSDILKAGLDKIKTMIANE